MTESVARELLDAFAKLAGPQRIEFLAAHPGLLSIDVIKQLVPYAKGRGKRHHEALAYADVARGRFDEDSAAYPLGRGPVERLLERLEGGDLTFDAALELVAAAEVATQLSAVYVQALSHRAFDLVNSLEWPTVEGAVRTCRLLLAGTAAAPDSPDTMRARHQCREDWLQVAKIALLRLPDGEWWQAAVQAGEWLLAHAPADQHGRVHFLIGTLHLDPYTVGRSSDNFVSELQVWNGALDAVLGPAAPEHRRRFPMPTATEALRTAVVHLRQAVDLRSGMLKGTAAKALLQAFVYQTILDQPVDTAEVRATIRTALDNLDDSPVGRQARNAVRLSASFLGQDDATSADAAAPSPPPSDDAARIPAPSVPAAILADAGALAITDPSRAFEVLAEAAERFANADPLARRARLHTMLRILPAAQGAGPMDLKSRPDALAAAVRADALRQGWPPRRLAATLLGIAAASTNHDEEELGLEIGAEALEADPSFSRDLPDLKVWLGAGLWLGLAVTRTRRDDWAGAVTAYAEAAKRYWALDFEAEVLDCLDRIADAARHRSDQMALAVCGSLAPLAFPLEIVFGPRAAAAMQITYKRASGSFGDRMVGLVVCSTLQLAKALRTTAVLAAGAGYEVADDAEGQTLLEAVCEAEREVATSAPSDRPELSAMITELIQVSYAHPGAAHAGLSASEVLANRQQAFDRHATARSLAQLDDPDLTPLLSPEGIQASLDARTVLLNYYLGEGPQEEEALYIMLTTAEEHLVVRNPLPAELKTLVLQQNEQSILISSVAGLVAGLRERLQWDSGPRPMHAEAVAVLGSAFEILVGTALMAELDRLRAAGKDHLCIVPHGALHYFPFHVVGDERGDLASRWAVTYLPALAYLDVFPRTPRVGQSRGGRSAALGLTFTGENPHRLPALPGVRTEVTTIASVMGAAPMLDDAATPDNFRAALRTCRWVHVSTHGRLNVRAPMFHCLYLSPDAKSDGRVFAYELLSERLTGLELVSLSACETALGRVNESDNLFGLPAALMTAGAATVVGTLWPVSSAVAETFFGRLYRALAAGQARVDAFWHAQQSTRAQYVRSRDWATFYLTGDST
jgi:CHAT domain-containing protein